MFDLLRILLIGIILALSDGAAGTVYKVETESMQPNFYEGEYVTVIPLDDQPLQRGEVIVFQNPFFLEETYVKRLIGLPGETVRLDDAKLWIDGQPLDEPYNLVSMPKGDHLEVTLQAEEYFVLGDNRPNSNDSRRMGPIHADLIVGRVKITAWNRLLNGGRD
jgi:signal peptidase I